MSHFYDCIYCTQKIMSSHELLPSSRVCENCHGIVTARPELADWVLMVVRNQVAEAIDEHERKNEHTRSSSCGCC